MMKLIVFAVALLLAAVAVFAVEQKESLKPAEQVYVASPYAAYPYGAVPAVGYGSYLYGR